MTWTIGTVLHWTTQKFVSLDFSTPLLDAQILVGHALGLSRIQLYMHMDKPLSDAEREKCRVLVKRRMEHEPVAYITGKKSWYELDLFVDKNVLIPRPETENIVDFVLAMNVDTTWKPDIVLDLCTGSGCLAIMFGKRFSDAKIYAFDCSNEALTVAKKNADLNKVTNIEWVLSDLNASNTHTFFETISLQKNVLIVANPPYLSESEWFAAAKEVKSFEPKLALVSEDQGYLLAKKILDDFEKTKNMTMSVVFVMELGSSQPKYFAEDRFSLGLKAQVYPREKLFILKDLEQKDRFIGYLSGC